MNIVRIGVVGLGNMGSHHARTLLEGRVNRATLGAVADVDARTLEDFRSVPCFCSAEDLFNSGTIDAVLIATPHYDHTLTGRLALERGFHVLVEKPISVQVSDANHLIAAHTNPGRVFAAMFNQRTDPRFQKIREMVRDGTLGNLLRVNWTITDWFRTEAYYASSNWRATWAGEGGGVLLNQATHNLDLWQWMFGMPIRVRAVCGFGRHHPIEVEDDVTAVFEYQHGATGVFVTSTGEAPGTNRLEIAGDRGRLVCEQDVLRFTQNLESTANFSRQSEKHYEMPPHIDREWRFPDRGGQHRAILENFVDAILDGAPLLSPAKEGLGAVELANAMLWSSSLDKPVSLPLDETGYRSFLQQLVRDSSLRSVSSPHKTVLETAPYL